MGNIMNTFKSAGKAIMMGAIRALWQPGKFAAQQAIKLIPEGRFREAGSGILNAMDAWVMGRDKEWDALAPNYVDIGGKGGIGPTGSGITADGISFHHGSGSWRAFVEVLQRNNIPYQNLGTYANRGTKYGTPSMHAQNRAMDFGGSQMQLQRINHALYDAFKPHLHELIWTGPNSRNVYRGKDHTFRPDIAADHRTHVHASMAQGGRFKVPRVPGGVNVNISEGRQGEMFQVLPVDDAETGGTILQFYGDLSFPNITNGGDAKELIDNLKALAT
jgi:hypothetical protein